MIYNAPFYESGTSLRVSCGDGGGGGGGGGEEARDIDRFLMFHVLSTAKGHIRVTQNVFLRRSVA